MGIYINPDSEDFREICNSEIYVDKTSLIDLTNQFLGTPYKYLCISQARRFGKTVAAKMLTAYYCNAYDSSEIFDKLKISDSANYREQICRIHRLYNVR